MPSTCHHIMATPQLEENHVVNDSRLLSNVLSRDSESNSDKNLFGQVRHEVQWHEMYHKGGPVPRLVSLQGEKTTEFEPLYRHPADAQPPLTPWTNTIRELRDRCSSILGGQPLNHALIQLYRSGDDYISEHADKTIDVQRNSAIVNLSLGATRTMVLRPKRESRTDGKIPMPRPAVRCSLTHGSMFVLGWKTNRTMTHEIRRDKRLASLKTADELAFDGMRISITFRHVATFIRLQDGCLVGQGAATPQSAVSGKEKTMDEEEALLRAFSNENRYSDFDWDEEYGSGFNVINFKAFNNSASDS